MDEQAAIIRMQAGDIGGLEPLVRRYQAQAISAAYLITRDPALAEDIVQGAFLRAYERIGQFDPTRSFAPWFLRSVVHDAIKAATRRAREHPWPADAPGREPVDPGPAPVELLIAAETQAAMEAALTGLPPEQRAAVVLRYYLGLSERETAARLALPLSTVKWRLHTARKHLRTRLPAWLQPAGGED